MKLALTLTAMLFAVAAQAEVAPGYRALKKMDAAMEALAERSNKNVDDMTVAGAIMGKEKSGSTPIQVDIGGANCMISVTTIPLPKGMIGSASNKGKLLKCSRYMNIRAPDVMKYEDVKAVLSDAAAQGKTDLSFRVTFSPQGPKVRLGR